MIEREKKRIKLNNKYRIKRQNLLKEYQTTEDFNLKLEIDNNQKNYEKLIDQTADEISNFVDKASLKKLS